MSDSAVPSPIAARTGPITRRSETRAFVWLIWGVATLCLWATFGTDNLATDDAMRLVEIRDWLSGQSWFDLTQYRLDPPAGVVTHWSRLIDLPIGLLIEAGKTIFPAAIAEHAAVMIWPAALLAALFAGTARIASAFAGPKAAGLAVLFTAMMAPTLQHFRFGAIHHHNVQLVLLVWSIALLLPMTHHPRNAAASGFLCALSIAVGQEMVPAIAALAVIVAVRWIFAGQPSSKATASFAGSLAIGAIGFAAATIPPSGYFVVHCDAISIGQVGALAIGGFGLAALTMLPGLNSRASRLTAALGLAIAIGAFIKVVAPTCIGDPYAQLDPRLADLWLSSVSEARGVSALWRDMPQQVLAYFGVPVAALVLGIYRCVRENNDEDRWNWIAVTAVQAVFLLLTVWQLRGAAGANVVAAAIFPAALLRTLPLKQNEPHTFGLRRAVVIVLLLLNPAVLLALGNGVAHAFAISAVTSRRIIASGDAGTCQRPGDYTPLAALPQGRVLAFIDSGPFILLQTSHAVFGAPYHRNQAGNLAVLDMLLADPKNAQREMAARGIDYVAFCPGAPERYQYADLAPHGLAATLATGTPPAFLQHLPVTGTDLAVYRVLR